MRNYHFRAVLTSMKMASLPRGEARSQIANQLLRGDRSSTDKPRGMHTDFLHKNESLMVNRTHRERKELYIKALEQEVLRLKELYDHSARDREHITEENHALKEILKAHGIQYDSNVLRANIPYNPANSQYGGSSTSITISQPRGSFSTGVTSPTRTGPSSIPNQSSMGSPPGSEGAMVQHSAPHGDRPNPQQSGVDYDQVGIDFVLTYDRTPYLSPPPQQ